MNTDTIETLRATREIRRLQEQMIRRQSDCLSPDERSMRNVWRSFRGRELWTALAAAVWLGAMWIALNYL